MTLSDLKLRGHSPVAGLVKCTFYSCAKDFYWHIIISRAIC